MFEINASHLFIGALGIIVGMVVWSLWQQRATLTPAGAIKAASTISGLTKLLYNDAVIIVQWLEQISQPKEGQSAISGAEKKDRAMRVLLRRAEQLLKRPLKNEEIQALDVLVEGVVFSVKTLGVKLPQVRLTGEAELLERLRQSQLDVIPPLNAAPLEAQDIAELEP